MGERMRLANTVGDRINKFDSLETQTVYTFNDLFPECPIRDTELETPVTILDPVGNNCREIQVGIELITHKMYSDILYTINKEDYFLDEREVELDEINGVPV
jgi:hypothetical protein